MRLPALLAFLTAAAAAWAAPVQQPHSEAELVPERPALTPGEPLTLALRLRMDERWHVYWKNPGDSGMATSIVWRLPRGLSAGDIQWPHPKRIDAGPLTSYGYEGEVFLLTDIQPPAGLASVKSVPIRAQVDWLVCEEICIPASAQFQFDLPVSTTRAAPDARWAAAFARARARLPLKLEGWRASAYRDAGELTLQLVPPRGGPRLDQLTFFPEREGLIDNARKQRLTRTAIGFDLRIKASTQPAAGGDRLAGVLVAEPGFGAAPAAQIDVPLAANAAPALGGGRGLLAALLLAFGGGALLNLMPCVFPVLAIKVLGLVQQTGRSAAKLRVHGLLFALGVLLSFWLVAGLLLAFRAQGAALGWGYQLQSPVIVAALAVLFFVLGLNLSGVFQFGAGLQSLAGSTRAKRLHADALLSGVLATAVASPCTAPFMGAALGFALLQPALDALLVFTALGLGMALPYLVLCFVPHLTHRLPRPGPWMETLQQLLAFPLYASVVWLVWVLGQQVGIDGAARLLAGLVLVAAALWAAGRWAHARSGPRYAARAIGLLLIAGALAFAWPKGQPDPALRSSAQGAWQPWSDEAVRAAVAQGRPAFVDFTAAWCVTCQVNKRLVLNTPAVEQRFTELGVVRFRADWTNRDPAISAALTRMHRSGVPVYALYLPGRGDPLLLPEVLTQGLVLDAIDQAARPLAHASAMITSSSKEQP